MSSQKLARNTIFLYTRMFIILGISLISTRLILSNLGIQDYGIYNVVGSFVSLFTFFQTAMSSANYRYFAYAIGENNQKNLNTSFKTGIFISLIIVLLTISLGELFGCYYIWNILNVPLDRFQASFWVFQISLISCCISTLYLPYYSSVIAHEKMSFFAYLSIIEAVLKILVVLLISFSPIDKLVFYSLLLLSCNIIILLSYYVYCNINFLECKKLKETKVSYSLLKEIGAFSSWTMFVTIADIFVMQGINMMINSFFTPIVNAARGIAVQIQGAVDQFRGNLQTAFNPQITKTYASNSYDDMFRLIYASAKYSTYIMLFLSIPLMFSIDYVLCLWLVEVPKYTNIFLKLILASCIIDGISNPFVTAIGATGKIRRFQSIVGSIKLLILPICWIALYIGCNPVHLFVIYLISTITVVFIRIKISSEAIGMSLKQVLTNILIPILSIAFFCSVWNYMLHSFMTDNFISFVLYCIESATGMILIIYLLGLNRVEKNYVKTFIRRKFA